MTAHDEHLSVIASAVLAVSVVIAGVAVGMAVAVMPW